MLAPALQIQDMACKFPSSDGSGESYTAIEQVTLDLQADEFVAIVGPTGCGKSTILNVAAGLIRPSAGSVKVFGKNLDGLNKDAGYMFQSNTLMPWRSALQNVCLGLEYQGRSKLEAHSIAKDWLKRVGLGGFEDRYPHQLSGGMQKRVSLAQTLALEPKIILMDEPFSALDLQTRQLMENEVLDLCQPTKDEPGKAVLFITHDLDEAIAMSDRVIVMSAGPGSRPIGNFLIDLPKPRDVAEIKTHPKFYEIYNQIWQVLRDEVLQSYAKQKLMTDRA
jgi:NitT/TauT family transport system ATP-binding protein